jgi:hypothetical protein
MSTKHPNKLQYRMDPKYMNSDLRASQNSNMPTIWNQNNLSGNAQMPFQGSQFSNNASFELQPQMENSLRSPTFEK